MTSASHKQLLPCMSRKADAALSSLSLSFCSILSLSVSLSLDSVTGGNLPSSPGPRTFEVWTLARSIRMRRIEFSVRANSLSLIVAGVASTMLSYSDSSRMTK
ncbi:hypothetical protein OE88DRAFT_283971 [Heliocybe sulcata]|uniref:Uncharacterized protein n=1 Tax=Heliocybe sulcata TaxID=5364 RepID=A0A5C3N0I6_9AGAM|nr:hypothetical protein OE88DRAFT_283971 [Heliocybe sulcata]